MTKMSARVPVIALSYSERHKATKKELLVDYTNGNIYVVSSEDKSIIFNVTEQIKAQLDKVSGDKIEINIEGIGNVKLSEALAKLIKESITVKDIGRDDVYIPKKERLDGFSIQSLYSRIQIAGFDTAENGMIPQRFGDSIRWIFPPQCTHDGSGSGNDPGIPNPDDGLSTTVHNVEPVNGKLFLRASRRQKTLNLHEDIRLIIPRTLDNFCEIFWCARTYSYEPKITFSDNVLFNTEEQPKSNSYHVYRFSTWDAGETWFASLEIYNKSGDTSTPGVNDPVDIEYLRDNYYNKDHIEENYLDKNEIDYNFVSKNFLKDNFFNKEDIIEGYFTKEKITELLSWQVKGKEMNENPQFKLPDYLLNR